MEDRDKGLWGLGKLSWYRATEKEHYSSDSGSKLAQVGRTLNKYPRHFGFVFVS